MFFFRDVIFSGACVGLCYYCFFSFKGAFFNQHRCCSLHVHNLRLGKRLMAFVQRTDSITVIPELLPNCTESTCAWTGLAQKVLVLVLALHRKYWGTSVLGFPLVFMFAYTEKTRLQDRRKFTDYTTLPSRAEEGAGACWLDTLVVARFVLLECEAGRCSGRWDYRLG